MKKLILKLLHYEAAKGEPAFIKPKRITVMPDPSITLLQWQRGEWVHYLNKNFKKHLN